MSLYPAIKTLGRYSMIWVPGRKMKPARVNGLGLREDAERDLVYAEQNLADNKWPPEPAFGKGQYCIVRDYDNGEFGEVAP